MSKVVIGIHGLGNKAPRETVELWWRNAIREGLRSRAYFHPMLDFKLIYWADILHPKPLDPREEDKDDPLFLEEPYIPAEEFEPQPVDYRRKQWLDFVEKQMDSLLLKKDMTINFPMITQSILHRYFKDLGEYYSDNGESSSEIVNNIQDLLRARVARELRRYQDSEILLIAHSMGSILAYDVLTQVTPEIEIDTFITMGSPLGLPVIMSRILAEQEKMEKQFSKPSSPDNIKEHWFNLSDLEDLVAINYNLADDYAPNSHGISALDMIVHNNYQNNGKRNPHKVYGYLRTPECAKAIHEFYVKHPNPLVNYLQERFAVTMTRFYRRI